MITPSIAVNATVKPSLAKDFGIALSALIILQKGRECNVMIVNLDRSSYIRLIEAITSDYRVAKTLGKDGAERAKKEWLAIVL